MKVQWLANATLCGAVGMAMLAPVRARAQAMSNGSSKMASPAAQGSAMAHASGQTPGSGPESGAVIEPAKVYGDIFHVLQQEITGAAEAMPEEKFSFAPTSGNFTGVRTFAQQLQHLTAASYMYFKPFGIGGSTPDKAKLEGAKSKAEIIQNLKDSFAYAQKGIDSMTPQNAFIAVTTGARPQTRAGNATFFLAHNMDHYGQLVEYLRMNGIVPPASQPRPGAKM